MNISILHSGDLENVSDGGISQYIKKLIKYKSIQDSITVFGTIDTNSTYKIGKIYVRECFGVKYKFIPLTTNKKKPLSIYYFLKVFKQKKIFNNYDIIYAQRMEYALPFVMNKNKKKLIFAVHGSGKYSYLFWGNIVGTIYSLFEKLALKTSKKVIVLLKREEFGVPYYKKILKNKDYKVEYGKVPIDTDIFKKMDKEYCRKKLKINQNDRVLIFFGRLINNPKQIFALPKIIKTLSIEIKNLKCIIIGDGEDKKELLKIIKNENIEKNFIIVEKLEHGTELVEYINCADASLILSNFEGICMSALESIACGVPVISTNVGDINQYVNNDNGIIVNTNQQNLIDDFRKAILVFFNTKAIKVNEIYKEYEGEKVMKDLRKIFIEVKNEDNYKIIE